MNNNTVAEINADFLIDQQEQAARLAGMLSVFERADKTLSGQKVSTAIVNEPRKGAPAWSDGQTITFNAAKIGEVATTDDLIKITGLNFHELAHVMYTPRVKSWLGQEVANAGCWYVFNMLEDQRIETFMSARYLSTKAYFNMVVLKFLLNDPSNWSEQHVLTYGRRYLPQKVRDEMQRRFKDQKKVPRINSLIDRYRVLSFPADDREALAIIKEFKALLVQTDTTPEDPFGHDSKGCRPNITQGDAYDQDQQDDTKSWVDYRDEEQADQDDEESDDFDDSDDSDDWDDAAGDAGDHDGAEADEDADVSQEDGQGGAGDEEGDDSEEGNDSDDAGSDGAAGDDDDEESSSDSDSSGQDGDRGGDELTDTDGSGSGDQSDSDSQQQSDGGQSDSGKGAGTGSTGNHYGDLTDDEFEKAMQDVYNDIANQPDVRSDIKDKEKAIEKTVGKSPSLAKLPHMMTPITPDYRLAARRFAKELSRMWADADPAWDSHRASGRVNIQRAMHGHDIDTVFDAWEEGKQDANDIDMVMLVDYSVSMRTQMNDASKSLWAIKRAVEEIRGEVTVIGYDDKTPTVMYDRYEKASPTHYRRFMEGAYTDPAQALAEAYTILKHSRAKHRIVLILTDGAWGNYEVCNTLVKKINATTITTALGFLADDIDKRVLDQMTADAKETGDDTALQEQKFHYCKAASVFQDAAGLTALAKAVVKQAMKE